MKTVYKFATMTVVVFVMMFVGMFMVSSYAFSQTAATKEPPTTTTQNLIRGVIGAVSTDNSWSGYSVENILPGDALFPITSTTTVFYFGFTAGTTADISNMVVYTTARGSLTVTAVTPVTLGGSSSPSINLSNTTICPVAPSAAHPCIVRFDPTTLTMTPSSDYYFMVYFTSDSNNSSIGGAEPSPTQTSIVGNYFGGTDYTRLKVGGTLPGAGNRAPNFLMYVMNN